MNNNTEENLLPIGTTLANGKYRIEKHLSSGGFGKTYLAIDTAFDERVAIKELYIKGVCGRDAHSNDISISLTENKRTFEAQREKFRKEARRLRKLSNPYIVKVHDLFDDNATSYYVMDYVEGDSLGAYLKKTKKPMPEGEVLKLLPQILDALNAVHAEGIWHLDLKPANIMIDKQGRVQLIDFGASKQLRNSSGDSLSTSSSLAYTQGYAPPEQMEQSFAKFGPWTDIYALGATLYTLLTFNKLPNPSDIQEDPDNALPFPPSVSQRTKDLVLWMMKPNRMKRPQSIADIQDFMVEGMATPQEQKQGETPVKPKVTDDTIIKNPTPAAPSTPPSETKIKEPFVGKGKLFAGILIATAIVVFTILTCSKGNGRNSGDDMAIDTTAVAEAMDSIGYFQNEDINLVDLGVVEHSGDMTEYNYTGNHVEGIPNGEGKATYNKTGWTYKGNFVNGFADGENFVCTHTDGDKFEGTVRKNYFTEGTYTLPDGQYFRGKFIKDKNGEVNPDLSHGQWYDR